MLYIQKIRLFLQLSVLALLLAGINPFYGPLADTVIIVSIFVLGNFFCGWICPFGAYQELLSRLGNKLIKNRPTISPDFDKGLSILRYMPLLIAIPLIESTLNSRHVFLAFIYDRPILQIAFYAFIFFTFLSLIIERPFCRWLCIKGASYSILSVGRLVTLKTRSECMTCKKCAKMCPVGIEPYKTKEVTDPRCIDCLNCISSCPVKKGLSFGLKNFSAVKIFLSSLAFLYLLYILK